MRQQMSRQLRLHAPAFTRMCVLHCKSLWSPIRLTEEILQLGANNVTSIQVISCPLYPLISNVVVAECGVGFPSFEPVGQGGQQHNIKIGGARGG